MKISNKKLQELCDDGPQNAANIVKESIVYQFFEDKFYTESQYRKKLEKESGKEYTDEEFEIAKQWDILTWFHPQK